VYEKYDEDEEDDNYQQELDEIPQAQWSRRNVLNSHQRPKFAHIIMVGRCTFPCFFSVQAIASDIHEFVNCCPGVEYVRCFCCGFVLDGGYCIVMICYDSCNSIDLVALSSIVDVVAY
jgi:hypothetical protein